MISSQPQFTSIQQFGFGSTINQEAQPNASNYPPWQKAPYWNEKTYNPNIVVYENHPDGTRKYYVPAWNGNGGVLSYEHGSGFHYVVGPDAVIENVPGRKITHIGGGGWEVTVHGHVDMSFASHTRMNYGGDVYQNVKGVHHTMHQGGAVYMNMGNEKHVHYGDAAHTVLGPNGSFGIGVGPGDGTNHDNALTVTNKRIYIRAYTGGDIYIQTKNNDVVINCGNTINISASANININAPNGTITANASSAVINTSQNATVSAQGSVSITGQEGISLSSPKTISISGNPTVVNGYSGGPYTHPWL